MPLRIPSHKLEEIRQRLSLAEVVRGHVPLKRKGRDLWGCCPFHQEKSPSFQVREAEGYYHCFGCGAHGNVFDFVMQMQGLPFPEAVERLAGQAGILLEKTSENGPKKQQKQDGLSALERAAVYFERSLQGEAKDYLLRRGLSLQTLAKFRLGFAADDWRHLKYALQNEGFNEATLLQTALVRQAEKGGEPYDTFRNRVMFPIENMQGKVVAFGGRVITGGEPKYLNSPQTVFFNKSQLLYGLYHAAPYIRKQNQALLVEGYMDVIALHQAGVQTAVAPMGTAVTEEQVALLWRYHDAPTVCLDGDEAGRKAAVRLAWRVLPVLQAGKSLQFVLLPQGQDPDSIIQQGGKEAFAALVTAPQPLEDLLWADITHGVDLTSGQGRAFTEKRIEELCQQIKDPTLQKHFRGALKDKLWAIIKANHTSKGGQTAGGRVKGALKKQQNLIDSDPNAGSVAQTLLAIILHKPEVLAYVSEEFAQVEYPQGLCQTLQGKLFSFLSSSGVENIKWGDYLLRAGLEDDVKNMLAKSGVQRLLEDRQATSAEEIARFWHALFSDHQRIRRKKRLASLVIEEVGQNIATDLDAWRRFKSAKTKGVGDEG